MHAKLALVAGGPVHDKIMCARDTAVTTLSHPRGAGAEARGAPPGVLPASAGYPPAFQTPEGASVAADGAVPNPLFASGDRGPSSEAAAGGPSEAGADAGRPMPAGAAAKSSAQPDEGLWEDQSPGGPRTPGPAPAASSAATPERQGSSHPDRMAGIDTACTVEARKSIERGAAYQDCVSPGNVLVEISS